MTSDPGQDSDAARCIVVGHAALDHVYRIERFPDAPVKMPALEHIDSGGGMAANAAAAIGRLGGRVQLWSRIGNDAAGQTIRQHLEDAGVDIAHLKTIQNARSSTAAILVDARGERLIVSERDHAMPMEADWLPIGQIKDAGAVVSDLNWREATLISFDAARRYGVPTLVDIDLGCGVIPEDILARTDYAVISAGALERFSPGDTLKARLGGVAARGVRHVGVTLGAEGYRWLAENGELREQSSFIVDVIDTTGAGDAFHGGFAWALAQRLPIEECVRVAAAVAALSCRRLGARDGLPSREELDAFLLAASGRGIGGRSA